MVGKNNKKEQLRKNATKNTRFSLKKLSVGVASVAVGASLLVGNVAHAEEVTPKPKEEKQQEQFLLQFVVDGVPQQTEAFTGTQQEFMEFQHSQAAARYSNAEFSRTWEGNKLVVTVTPKEADPSVPTPKPEVEAKETYKFVVKREGQEDQVQELQFNSRQEAQVYAESFQKNQAREGEVLESADYGLPADKQFTFVYKKEAPKPKKEETKFEYQFVVDGEERAAVGYTASSIQEFMDYLTGYISNEFPDTKKSPRYEWDGNSVKVFIETENKVKEERKDYKLVFVVDGEEVLSADYENHTYEEFYANVAENLKNQEAKGRYNTKLVVDGGVYTYTFETRAQSGEPEKHEKDELPKEKILELYKEQTIKDLKARGFNNEFVFGAINKANTIEGIDSIVKELNLEPTTEEKLAQYKEKTINELKAKGFNNKLVFDIIRRAKTIEGVDSVVANLDLSDLDEEAGKKLDAAKAGALEDIAGLDYFTAEEKSKLEDLVNEVESFDEFVEKVDKAISEAIEENDKRHKAAQSSEEKPGDKEEQKPGKEEQKPGKEEQKPGKEEQKPGKEEQKPGQKESDKGQLQSAKDNAKGEIDKLPNLSDKQKGDLKAGLDKADSLAKVQEILDFARKLNKDQAPKQEDKKEEKKGQRLPDTATGAWALGLVGVSSLLAGAGVKKFKK
ncbi:Gram-positive signal peptide protein, YSIRK family [Lactobacillus reuteri] [Dolosigranulum pigrum]|nr:Gram-positive signal peptide protein, YSIRK family [Lactobacillus reuteri] [Dolosigranulum pigrum]